MPGPTRPRYVGAPKQKCGSPPPHQPTPRQPAPKDAPASCFCFLRPSAESGGFSRGYLAIIAIQGSCHRDGGVLPGPPSRASVRGPWHGVCTSANPRRDPSGHVFGLPSILGMDGHARAASDDTSHPKSSWLAPDRKDTAAGLWADISARQLGKGHAMGLNRSVRLLGPCPGEQISDADPVLPEKQPEPTPSVLPSPSTSKEREGKSDASI